MYYTIKQMAQMFDVTEHTLRYYTDQGLLPCERDGGNRRVFNDESINWMQGIKCLKGCGASIEDIREYCRLRLLPFLGFFLVSVKRYCGQIVWPQHHFREF